MIADDLIETAEILLSSQAGPRKQAILKRVVSTAYYALFHALAYNNVDALLGWGFQSPRYWEVVSPVYRLIEHGSTKNALARLPRDHPQAAVFKRVASSFAELQKQRYLADYEPKPCFSLSAARELVEVAREAVKDIRQLDREERRFLASQLVAKTRPGTPS